MPFLLPFFVVFVLFVIAPIVYTLYLSLFTERSAGLGFGGTETIFVAFTNYSSVLTDRTFLASFAVIAVYCLFYIPVMIGLALVLTLLMDTAACWGRRFFQLAFYLPNVVPGLIAAIIWLYLYTPGISPVVDTFEALGGSWSLSSLPASLFSIANITVWLHVGYNCVIFFAALQAIPAQTLEAARVDGAGAWRTAWSVKIPMIRSAIGIATLMTIVGALQLFTEPMLLRSRASGIDSTWTPTMYIYQKAFTAQDFGMAAAAAIIFAVVIGAVSFGATRSARRTR